jgi:hypothetical protein
VLTPCLLAIFEKARTFDECRNASHSEVSPPYI